MQGKMVHTDQVSPGELPTITEQLATRLRALSDDPHIVPLGATIKLGRSFAHWTLGADVIASLGGDPSWPDLLELAKPLNRWHHQIEVDEKAVGFFHAALSTDAAMCSLFVSAVATNIEEAFAWINDNVTEDLLVRLLEIPGYHLITFWLIDETKSLSRVLVVNSLAKSTLKRGQILTSRELLEALRKQRHIGGIKLERRNAR
jgi:hypothetical protein